MPTESSILYNPELLAEEARQLSVAANISRTTRPLRWLQPLISHSKDVLTDVYRQLATAAQKDEEITPAGEWVIDNFYIMQEQFQVIGEDMPLEYYIKLPRIKDGVYKGFPRVYQIVNELSNFTDNILDVQNIDHFVKSYQEAELLSLGELWAIPIMIRVVLIKKLEERAVEIIKNRRIRESAQKWVRQILQKKEDDPAMGIRLLVEMTENYRPMTPAFLVMVANQLQAAGSLLDLERAWLDSQFRSWHTTLEEEIRHEAQRQTQLQVSVRNAVISLRKAIETDWSDFVENRSIVEQILRLDPSGVYPNMDFKTRDLYRKRIEQLSGHSNYSEFDVAQKLLLAAEESMSSGGDTLKLASHVGYYLIDEGKEKFNKILNYKKPIGEWFRDFSYRHSWMYMITIFMMSAALITLAILFTHWAGANISHIIIVSITSIIPAFELSVVSLNWLLTLLLPPRFLPRMNFEYGIPDEHRTLVVVPTLASTVDEVDEQIDMLEVRSLANLDPALRYALLLDLKAAQQKKLSVDTPVINKAIAGIRALNKKYHDEWGDRFFLLYRERIWNPKEKQWMAWERKRGKLEELNRILRDPSAKTTFTTIEGDFFNVTKENAIRYVITLDADTRLPPGSARALISTAAHILNHPKYDPAKKRVVRGYGVLQPRISISPETAGSTAFSQIFSGNVGLDPYTTAVSDVYQDLFGEGIYTGKGLYVVDAFKACLDDTFPENTILSHDLIESNYARAALVTGIELFDDYPSNYLSYSRRLHRWIRGDWQILYWIFPRVPSPQGWIKNPVTILGRWKILDNIRRSLTPVSLLLFLLFGWTYYPGPPIFWTLLTIVILAFPIYSNFSLAVFLRPRRVAWKLYFQKLADDITVNTLQVVLAVVMLADRAFLKIDAITQTLWRMFISKENLLEWTPARHFEQKKGHELRHYIVMMKESVIWGGISIMLTAYFKPVDLVFAIPLGGLWILAPWVAWITGLSRKKEKFVISNSDEKLLRLYARRTWMFFEKCVGPQCSWLPPDNIQEEPPAEPAKRTSPTNIGMALSSAQVAYDFGYMTRDMFLYRVGQCLGSMRLLERYKGHFFNWYNTTIGAVLPPKYISTVDSGNLACSLIALKQSFFDVHDSIWPNPSFFEGLGDTIRVLRETMEMFRDKQDFDKIADEVNDFLDQFEALIPENFPEALPVLKQIIEAMHPIAEKISMISLDMARSDLGDIILEETEHWLSQLLVQIEAQYEEISFLFPFFEEKTERFKKISRPQSLQNLCNELKKLNTNPIEFKDELRTASNKVSGWLESAERLSDWCQEMVLEMDFSFLYVSDRNLFSIGFNVDKMELDDSTYDLLASEARLASFIAIAKGDVPPKHWFQLSRRLTEINKNEILLSWGGTMFEYLMPLLFMRRYDKTLLSATYYNVVLWQKNYAERRKRPWGISESAYYIMNLDFDYQYRAFGVPGLGLRRGLAEEYVVAPYATMLALMIDPDNALKNLQKLREIDGYGPLGFYEAIDYTKDRLTPDQERGIAKTYMAHHQGMSMVAIYNLLCDNKMQNRFHNDPLVKSCELLLQERIPKGVPITEPNPIEVELEPSEQHTVHYAVEYISKERLFDVIPRVHLLSNGRYSTMITNAGTGYSNFQRLRLTRWRSDITQDTDGFHIYVKDLENNDYWTMGYQPAGKQPDRYEAWFHTDKVQMARVDHWIETFMEICVTPEDDFELRRCTLTNYADRPRKLEITSFMELVINDAMADASHPAFSKLFIQTDYLPEYHALLAKRRPRGTTDDAIWLVHTLASHDLEYLSLPLQFETARDKFIGRGRSKANPQAMDPNVRLSGTSGNVLDPIFSLRRQVELKPGEKIQVSFGLGVAHSREDAERLADIYDNPYSIDRAFELSKVYGLMELENVDLSGERALYFQNMAGSLLYGNPDLRATESIVAKNRKKQSGLWTYGISGDYPVLAFFIRKFEEMKAVHELLKAHAFWRQKGLEVDLVILNEHVPSYVDEMQEIIQQAVQSSSERHLLNKRGGIYVLRTKDMPDEDLVLIQTVARIVIHNKLPKQEKKYADLDQMIAREIFAERKNYRPVQPVKGKSSISDGDSVDTLSKDEDLVFYNGYGGFTKAGKEYVIKIRADNETGQLVLPPMPWINVIANEKFGFIATERGAGNTWNRNSRENRLTPWSNDPVEDPVSEAVFIRDEKEQVYWSPTPGPVPGFGDYETRHGFGYTNYRHTGENIKSEMLQFVPLNEPLKISRLRMENTGKESKNLTLFFYLEWALGVFREQSAHYVVTRLNIEHNLILAENFYNNEFSNLTAFCGVISEQASINSFTCDRMEFIGRNGNASQPAALNISTPLEGTTGCCKDPCAAFEVPLELYPGKSVDIYFISGQAEGETGCVELFQKYLSPEMMEKAYQEVNRFWEKELSVVKLETPSSEMDIMMNGWLLYQNLSCRMWARTAFYQSGGAFGFRDQLQDALAVVYADPVLTRSQILLHAAHQFTEGDVLHWWHPPIGRGIRTKFSDDLLWLPYAVAYYTRRTGDLAVLDEQVPFIKARLLEEYEDETYLFPVVAEEKSTLYDHCCRAIDRSLDSGIHNLPLMGSGDWNDGMNLVGNKGQGESIWLGFFLYEILKDFIPMVQKHSDKKRLVAYKARLNSLKKALNENGWDGNWFLRAFYDDGSPLGSAKNEECRIDAIAQAWSVISGAARPKFAMEAMKSAEEYLISNSDRIIRLLTPPFDKTDRNPGYIKGYIPGVRENGGQYTHAALWVIQAMAMLKKGTRAVELMEMLCPVNHARSYDEVQTFKVEPYSVPADVYGVNPHVGRGGWTWYTGSAGWMYRIMLESILGFTVYEGEYVIINPCISSSWKQFKLTYRPIHLDTAFEIMIKNPDQKEKGIASAEFDGKSLKPVKGQVRVPVESDNKTHQLIIIMGDENKNENSRKGTRSSIKK